MRQLRFRLHRQAVWETGGYGNDCIQYHDFASGGVYGFMRDVPAQGDYLLSRMRDGQVMVARFLSVSRVEGGSFRGKTEYLGYLGDPRLPADIARYVATAEVRKPVGSGRHTTQPIGGIAAR